MRASPRSALALFTWLVLSLIPGPLRAQGCAQCRDSTQAAPPATQSSYRSAILLLGGTAVAVSAGAAIVMWRSGRSVDSAPE